MKIEIDAAKIEARFCSVFTSLGHMNDCVLRYRLCTTQTRLVVRMKNEQNEFQIRTLQVSCELKMNVI